MMEDIKKKYEGYRARSVACARDLVDCPKCGETAGNPCRTPKGRVKNDDVHMERSSALLEMGERDGVVKRDETGCVIECPWVHFAKSIMGDELFKEIEKELEDGKEVNIRFGID